MYRVVSCLARIRKLRRPVQRCCFASKKDDSSSFSPLVSADLSASLTGMGQVIFLNSQRSGGIILASLAIGDPFLASLAATGAATSTATARRVELDDIKTNSGLFSYNGCLVGCATAVFIVPEATTTLQFLSAAAITAGGAAATTFLSVSLGHYLTHQPQWTYSFNFVAIPMLLRHAAWVQEQPPQVASTTTTALENSITAASPSFLALVLGTPFKGLSQIFVVENTWTGLGIAVAIASYSPQLAAHALMGSTVGSLTGYWVLQAPLTDVAAGLYGYNGALVSMAVGVFSVPSRSSLVLSAGGAAASSLVFGALSQAMPVPCLTLPFCLTMSAIYPLLQQQVSGLKLAPNPHSPEKNVF